MQQIMVDKAISLLDEALLGGLLENISLVACYVHDMIFDARNEMAQEKGQERMTKNRHNPIATPSSATRPRAKKKALAKGKGLVKKKAKK